MATRKIKGYFVAALCLLALSIPGGVSDFKPSEELAKYSVVLGLIVALFFWPLFKEMYSRSSKGVIGKLFLAFVIFPLGIAIFGFAASIGTLGFAANKVVGAQHTAIESVVTKGCIRRKCRCKTRVRLTSNKIMSNGSFCLESTIWQELQIGQNVVLTGVSSRLGFDVDTIEIIR